MGKHTISLREMERQAKRAKQKNLPVLPTDHWRPQTRADCAKVPRPCPYVTCRYNLFLDVCPNGSLRLPRGESEDAVLGERASCALDLAAEGERTLDDVGKVQALTRERVRQIEGMAVAKVRAKLADKHWSPGRGVGDAGDEHSLVGGSDMDAQFASAQAVVVNSVSG